MEILKKYLNNELFRASILLLILSNMGNLINFTFQFLMARMLNNVDFGALSFISNLVFVFGVPALAIQTAISKKTMQLNINKKYGKIRGLFRNATEKLFLISLILVAMFVVLSYFLNKNIKMDFFTLFLSSITIIFSLLYPIIIGIMQGMKKFVYIGWNNILGFSVKLLISLVLVIIGLRVYGAIIGIILGMFIAWISGLWILKGFKEEKEEAKFYESGELMPFIALLIITLMYTIDILIGKFIFNPEVIGDYSKVSLIGKMILFACLSIGTVMFPLSLEKHIAGNKTSGVIRRSVLLTSIICLLALLIFYSFGNFILSILFGEINPEISILLVPVGFAFSMISGINLIVLYGLSINKFKLKESLILTLLFIAQIFALIFLSQNLEMFVMTFGISSSIIFISLLTLALKWKKLL